MSAEPRDSVAQAIDAAVDRATAELRRENEVLRAGLAEARAPHFGPSLLETPRFSPMDTARLCVEAALAERAEIMKILESLTTEWRPAPGETTANNGNSAIRRVPVVSSNGVVQIPSNVASPAEVWILERAMARIRART